MDKFLIENLALEADFDGMGEMFPFVNGQYVMSDKVIRFAALIAEECAKVAETLPDPHARDIERSDFAHAIRAKFAV